MLIILAHESLNRLGPPKEGMKPKQVDDVRELLKKYNPLESLKVVSGLIFHHHTLILKRTLLDRRQSVHTPNNQLLLSGSKTGPPSTAFVMISTNFPKVMHMLILCILKSH